MFYEELPGLFSMAFLHSYFWTFFPAFYDIREWDLVAASWLLKSLSILWVCPHLSSCFYHIQQGRGGGKNHSCGPIPNWSGRHAPGYTVAEQMVSACRKPGHQWAHHKRSLELGGLRIYYVIHSTIYCGSTPFPNWVVIFDLGISKCSILPSFPSYILRNWLLDSPN